MTPQRETWLGLLRTLRAETGAPVSLCRRALEECGCDYDKALEYVQKYRKPLVSKDEQAGRIETYVHRNRIGVMVEVRCATDFVANTDEFKTLCKELCLQVVGVGEENLLEQPYVRDPKRTVKDLVEEVAQRVSEPITVKRTVRWELGDAKFKVVGTAD
jgi:elongation factor Ts